VEQRNRPADDLACGKRGADVRPDFNWREKPVAMMGIDNLCDPRSRGIAKWRAMPAKSGMFLSTADGIFSIMRLESRPGRSHSNRSKVKTTPGNE
jgi:hypothetical protein